MYFTAVKVIEKPIIDIRYNQSRRRILVEPDLERITQCVEHEVPVCVLADAGKTVALGTGGPNS